MRTSSFAPFAALLVPGLVFTAVVAHRPAASPESEVARLRRHFATVERELLSRDVSHLTPDQRTARARHIQRLGAYSRTGVFPKNTDFPDRRVPYFIDRVGTRCAMAYLIEQSGSGDYVARVAATRNNATVAELAADPELGPPLAAWLEENGLTVGEAARIQPMYCGTDFGWGCIDEPIVQPRPAPSPGYKIGTGVAFVTSASMLALGGSRAGARLSRRTSGWLSIGAGALALTLGLSSLDGGGDFDTLAPLNTAVGTLSLLFGAYTLSTPPPAPTLATSDLRASPWIDPRRRGAGVMLSLTF